MAGWLPVAVCGLSNSLGPEWTRVFFEARCRVARKRAGCEGGLEALEVSKGRFVLWATQAELEHPPASLPLRRAGEARPHLQLHQVVHDVLDGRANAASTPPCQRVPGVRVGPTGLTCSLARAAGGGPTGGTCEAAGNPASRKGTCRANETSSPPRESISNSSRTFGE